MLGKSCRIDILKCFNIFEGKNYMGGKENDR